MGGCEAAGGALTAGSSSAGSLIVGCSDSAEGAWKGNSSGSAGDSGSPVGADLVMTGAPLFVGTGAVLDPLAFCETRRFERMRAAPWGLPLAVSPLVMGDAERGLRVMGETPESGDADMIKLGDV
jgi:hypothetical protein